MKNFCKQLREQKQLSMKEVAQALGMTCQNLRDLENNKIALSSRHFDILCNIFNCSVGELFGENPVPDIDIVKLKFYNNPNLLLDLDNNKYTLLSLPKEMLKFYNITNTQNIISIQAWENNMKPTILKDNFLLIDTSDKAIKHKSIYLLKEKICKNGVHEDEAKIKEILLENPFSQTVIIKSLEEMAGNYPPYKVKIEVFQQMIIGQVIYCGKPIL